MTEEKLSFDSFEPPPFYGTGEMLTWQTNTLLESIDKKRLFSEYWHNGRQFENSAHTMTVEEMHVVFNGLEVEIIADSLIDARGYYCFYPIITDKEEVVLLSPNDFHTELATIRFPRQEGENGMSLADYFRPEMDVLPVCLVTLGPYIDEKCRQLLQNNDAKAFFLQGICQGFVTVIIDKIDTEIRRALFLPREQGQHFVFGEPGIPLNALDQSLLDIICAEERLGIIISDGNSLQPTFSALSLFVPHPER